MKITFINLVIAFSFISALYKVISPNPVKAKGIATEQKTKVRMVSEKVVVDLFSHFRIQS